MIKRRCMAFAFCIILILSSYNVMADKKSDLQNQKSAAQSEMNEIKTKIDEAQKNKTPYLERKKTIDSQMAAANEKLNSINMKIASVQSDINAAEKELEILDGEENKATDLFKGRMRALYEDDATSYFDIILNSTSISDFFYRLDVIKQITEYDQKVINRILDKKKIVKNTQSVLESKKAEIEVLKTAAEKEKANVEKLQSENQTVLDAINNDINLYNRQLKEKEKESARIESQIKMLLEQQAKNSTTSKNASNYSSQASSSGFIWPCPASRYITSYFGRRVHPVYKTVKVHNGLDIGGPNGTNIVASNSGTVIVSEYSSSYGNYIIISHGGGITTLYAHMSARLVSVGANVSKGQVIGREGSTGISTGPHLHFEVAVNGVRCDPLNYVR